MGVLYVDVDGLKRVNDTLGHDRGDAVLAESARRLAGAVGDGDVVARMGGDEFAVLVRRRETVAAVRGVADAVLASMAAPWPRRLSGVGGHAATVSIGVAVADGSSGGHSAGDLVRAADLAMLRAKRRGGAHVEVLTAAAVRTAVAERRRADALAEAVEHALAHETFDLRYQPVYCTRCGEAVRVEALLRVLSAEGAVDSPERLLSAAEATGRLDRVTAWVLDRALDDTRGWWFERAVPVAVNMSATELAAPSGPGEVLAAVRGSTLPARALVLEVHRPPTHLDLDGLAAGVQALATAGVGVVLEDADTRWPAAELVAIAPNGLSLTHASLDAGSGERAAAAVADAVLGIADSVRASVTAKTIETTGQLDAALRRGCTMAQGTLLAAVSLPERIAWRTPRLTMRDAADPVLTGDRPLATVHSCTTPFSYADRALAENRRSRDPSSPPGPGGFSRPRAHFDAAEES